MPAMIIQVAKADSEILAPEAAVEQAYGSRDHLRPGERVQLNQLPSSTLVADSWESCIDISSTGKCLSVFMKKHYMLQIQQLNKDKGTNSGEGWQKKNGLCIGTESHFPKCQECPSKKCLTQTTWIYSAWGVLVSSVVKLNLLCYQNDIIYTNTNFYKNTATWNIIF